MNRLFFYWEPKVGIEPTFPLYESGVLPLNYLGAEKSDFSVFLEPLTGIEPVTSSFVYTSPYGRTRLYLSPKFGDPCQSFGRLCFNTNATVLTFSGY